MKIGEFLSVYRKKHSLSMEELAGRCGLSKAYISKLEANIDSDKSKQIKPSIQTFNKIANGLNISLTELLSTLDAEQEVTLTSDHNSITDTINKSFIKEINSYFEFLSDAGKKEAIKRIEELTYVPKYSITIRNTDTPKVYKLAGRNGPKEIDEQTGKDIAQKALKAKDNPIPDDLV